ncbi:hypothetical protein, partial [Halomonas sp. NO4]|uniref:hypothetical protein n=1 Tax=Halomonas sp. NO4 TaxID=2484813 RepID=UPI001969C3FD
MTTLTATHAPSTPVDTATDDTRNRLIADALDNQLSAYARTGESFTISEVRDQLLKSPPLADLDSVLLRYRVRDRLATLEAKGLAHRVGMRGKNRPLFQLSMEASPQQRTEANAPDARPASSIKANTASPSP